MPYSHLNQISDVGMSRQEFAAFGAHCGRSAPLLMLTHLLLILLFCTCCSAPAVLLLCCTHQPPYTPGP